jgi:hypothetical protein
MGGPRLSAGERKEGLTPSVRVDAGPGWLSRLGRKAPPRPFSYFLFLSLFFFGFCELFQMFCKNASNHFKQIPKFLKSSKQPSKPI